MTEHTQLHRQLIDIFTNSLNLEAPSLETDLVESGLLDSLTLVELFLSLEREFGVRISLEDFEVDDFRSITSIAQFVARQGVPALA
jgi:acyl carrier protein